MDFLKWRVFAIVASSVLAGWSPAVSAANFPSKPLTIYVGYPPGGTADRTARILAEMMSRELKQPVIVENRNGASQTIAAHTLLQAAPDGHSLLVVAEIDFASKVSTDKTLAFHLSDFRSVCGTATTPYLGVVVRKDARWKTIDDLVAELKAKPGSLSWGTAGYATGHFWAMEMLQREAGVKVLHVPYQGGGPAITALLGGQIDLMGGTYALWSSLLRSGQVRALVVQGPERIQDLPGVPSYADKGWSPALKQGWMRVLVPRKTPDAAVATLAKACEALTTDKRAQDALRLGGADPVYMSPEEASKHAADDEAEIARLSLTAPSE